MAVQPTKFYIQMPLRDGSFKSNLPGMPEPYIIAATEIDLQTAQLMSQKVDEYMKKNMKLIWPTLPDITIFLKKEGWRECEGPAKQLTLPEWKEINTSLDLCPSRSKKRLKTE